MCVHVGIACRWCAPRARCVILGHNTVAYNKALLSRYAPAAVGAATTNLTFLCFAFFPAPPTAALDAGAAQWGDWVMGEPHSQLARFTIRLMQSEQYSRYEVMQIHSIPRIHGSIALARARNKQFSHSIIHTERERRRSRASL